MRILITEDDAVLAEALQFSLVHSGYAVDWVSNGVAADEALKDGRVPGQHSRQQRHSEGRPRCRVAVPCHAR